MAIGAARIGNGAVHDWLAQIDGPSAHPLTAGAFSMAAETELVAGEKKELAVVRGVHVMTDLATAHSHRPVLNPLTGLVVTFEAEKRLPLLEQFRTSGPVWVVTICTGPILHRSVYIRL